MVFAAHALQQDVTIRSTGTWSIASVSIAMTSRASHSCGMHLPIFCSPAAR